MRITPPIFVFSQAESGDAHHNPRPLLPPDNNAIDDAYAEGQAEGESEAEAEDKGAAGSASLSHVLLLPVALLVATRW